jgi:hypothetical protein
MLNINRPPTTTVAEFFIPFNSISKIEQKLYSCYSCYMYVTCMCYMYVHVIDMEFSKTFYKYFSHNISVKQWQQSTRAPTTNMSKGHIFPCYAIALLNFMNTVPTWSNMHNI